jgi:hypothetical protein
VILVPNGDPHRFKQGDAVALLRAESHCEMMTSRGADSDQAVKNVASSPATTSPFPPLAAEHRVTADKLDGRHRVKALLIESASIKTGNVHQRLHV